jgi:Ca-activated chloride channel family protein
MALGYWCRVLGALRLTKLALVASVALLLGSSASRTENAAEQKPPPCTEDAVVVFDASGSMSGNQTLGIPNTRARIDEARSALAQVVPNATKFRKVGLVTYGPGPYNQCNVKLEFPPQPNAAVPIMRAVNSIIPAGRTPLTAGIEQAAVALDYRTKPGVVVVLTDGEETCGRNPCELAKKLKLDAHKLTIHVIAFRYDTFSWTGGNSIMDLICVPNETHGLYIKANSEEELVEALEKTLDCPMVSHLRGREAAGSRAGG